MPWIILQTLNPNPRVGKERVLAVWRRMRGHCGGEWDGISETRHKQSVPFWAPTVVHQGHFQNWEQITKTQQEKWQFPANCLEDGGEVDDKKMSISVTWSQGMIDRCWGGKIQQAVHFHSTEQWHSAGNIIGPQKILFSLWMTDVNKFVISDPKLQVWNCIVCGIGCIFTFYKLYAFYMSHTALAMKQCIVQM